MKDNKLGVAAATDEAAIADHRSVRCAVAHRSSIGFIDIRALDLMQPTIRELVVYTPAEDFQTSKKFYAALGFELTEGWGGTMDCRLGGAVFRLQNYYVKDWAENFMMKFYVEDAQAWHELAKKVIDEGNYPNARYDEPETIGDTKICHVWDPCGVLLIFIQ